MAILDFNVTEFKKFMGHSLEIYLFLCGLQKPMDFWAAILDVKVTGPKCPFLFLDTYSNTSTVAHSTPPPGGGQQSVDFQAAIGLDFWSQKGSHTISGCYFQQYQAYQLQTLYTSQTS